MRRTMNIGNRNTYNVILAKPALESFIPGASIQFKNVSLKADLHNWISARSRPLLNWSLISNNMTVQILTQKFLSPKHLILHELSYVRFFQELVYFEK